MKGVVFQGWGETPHLDKAAQDALLSSYPIHERDARTKGIPSLGSGAIYPVALEDVLCKPFDIPPYWTRGYGFDVGWNMTAAIWGAHDREADVVYLYSEHYRGHAEPSIHAEAIRARGEWMHGVIDPASRGRSQKDGEQLFAAYLDLGLHLSTAKNGVEAGLLEVWQRLSTGRLRVFDSCQNWVKEYMFYQRDDKGRVVKKLDHLMDATRYLIVSGIPNMLLAPDYLSRMGHKPAAMTTDYDVLREFA